MQKKVDMNALRELLSLQKSILERKAMVEKEHEVWSDRLCQLLGKPKGTRITYPEILDLVVDLGDEKK